jgi:hypothetical protein
MTSTIPGQIDMAQSDTAAATIAPVTSDEQITDLPEVTKLLLQQLDDVKVDRDRWRTEADYWRMEVDKWRVQAERLAIAAPTLETKSPMTPASEFTDPREQYDRFRAAVLRTRPTE